MGSGQGGLSGCWQMRAVAQGGLHVSSQLPAAQHAFQTHPPAQHSSSTLANIEQQAAPKRTRGVAHGDAHVGGLRHLDVVVAAGRQQAGREPLSTADPHEIPSPCHYTTIAAGTALGNLMRTADALNPLVAVS